MKFQDFRKKYPRFIYEKYSYRVSKNNLEISFDFKIEPSIHFRPKIVIENIDKSQIKKVGDRVLNNLIFHLGLIEMISYWKATCSPVIEIRTGYLNKEQINWWKDLIMKGMGQFFYENKIPFQKPKFLITSPFKKNLAKPDLAKLSLNKILVPVAGGKDSAVTLELLKKAKKELSSFSLNPTEATLKIMKKAGCKKQIIVRRKIDEKLLELNRQGFLNGHTPFSAYLAFLSVLVATLFDYKYIAVSNERSSNEGNVKYLGKIINHQWSKSFEFEQKFRKYSQKYLISKGEEDKSSSSPFAGAREIEYFSFLRPLYEIQIAKIFSQHPKYFPVFRSCNKGQKTNSWCGKCSKCLFVFTILYPFLQENDLLKIFRKNLFNDKKLLPTMQQLIGKRGFKPFECVGTKRESLAALYLSWKYGKLPFLLKYFQKKILPKYPNLEKESKKILDSWNNQHNLPKNLKKILEKETKKLDTR